MGLHCSVKTAKFTSFRSNTKNWNHLAPGRNEELVPKRYPKRSAYRWSIIQAVWKLGAVLNVCLEYMSTYSSTWKERRLTGVYSLDCHPQVHSEQCQKWQLIRKSITMIRVFQEYGVCSPMSCFKTICTIPTCERCVCFYSFFLKQRNGHERRTAKNITSFNIYHCELILAPLSAPRYLCCTAERITIWVPIALCSPAGARVANSMKLAKLRGISYVMVQKTVPDRIISLC